MFHVIMALFWCVLLGAIFRGYDPHIAIIIVAFIQLAAFNALEAIKELEKGRNSPQ
ncbi:hypothetical protein MHZ92_14465 [Sporosarcina sp. ACRSL]|uniref:hypothetical protein n=1 Tax=Sporosarcina sp. ACRSL TaxID=2918215 RepID=UPI001EF72E9C|nr:hypothetical protein [Sporosarcina sp. ACRSL]MCG7345340.1 hypothetical protein [Sporosarcina sp. ACRSL]